MEGNHTLSQEISVSNASEFSMLPMENTELEPVITCTDGASLIILTVGRVYIRGLTFVGCGGSRVESVDDLTIEYSMFHGQANSGTALTIDKTTADIAMTSFFSHTVGSYRSDITFFHYLSNNMHEEGAMFGGVLVVFRSILGIRDCQFDRNRANIGGAIYTNFDSEITISDSTFTSNHAICSDHSDEHCFGGALFVDGSSTVTVHNGTFQNNTSDRDGGVATVFNANLSVLQSQANNNTANVHGGIVAAYHNSFMTFEDTTLHENNADDGGVVYVIDSSIVTMTNSVLTGNIAGSNGGAVYAEKESIVTIGNCEFDMNTAILNNGGALHAMQDSNISIEVSNLTNNTARSGGAISATLQCNIEIVQSMFDWNVAGRYGGAVVAQEGSTVTSHDSTFCSNNADYGGALNIYQNSSLAVDGSTFLRNRASYGGAISEGDGSSLIVDECMFGQNSANADGGGLYVFSSTDNTAVATDNSSDNPARITGYIVINHSTFDGNKADQSGGVLYARQRDINIDILNSTITNNSAADAGGAVIVYLRCNVNITNSVFMRNQVDTNGGAVALRNGSIVTTNNCKFVNNMARFGGALHVFSNIDITIDRSMFHGNGANDIGGAIRTFINCSTSIFRSNFTNNMATIGGGLFYMNSNSTLTVSNSKFNNNSVVNNGVILASHESAVIIHGSTFDNNAAGYDGGVLHIYDGTISTIHNCTFTNNRAFNTGGTMYVRQNSIISVSDCRIYNSTAGNQGGAIQAQQYSNVSIEMCNFTNSTADFGGTVHSSVFCNVSISNSNFLGNRANLGGGVVAAFKSSIVAVQKSNFSFNIAPFGGVAIVVQTSNLSLVDSTFFNNMAVERGGVLWIFGPGENMVTVAWSTFENNTAQFGGVVYGEGSYATLKSSRFQHNSAKLNGGVVYDAYGGTCSVDNCTFLYNTAQNHGGVVALVSGSIATIGNSDFVNNSAIRNGGVLHTEQSTATVINSVFNHSSAGGDGGAMYHTRNSALNITNSSFTNNFAADNGGVVVVLSNSSLIVKEGHFMMNTARKSGGVLYLRGNSNSTMITDSIFQYNRAFTSGGAILASTASVVRIARSHLTFNSATMMGGAVMTELQSSISFEMLDSAGTVNNETLVSNNTAKSGGGLFITESELTFEAPTTISHNRASESGGGVSACTSSITVGYVVDFTGNEAQLGGAISLQRSNLREQLQARRAGIDFTSNQADMYGGALYVDDRSETAICYSNPYDAINTSNVGCFFQNVTEDFLATFNNNYAPVGGHDLFGGLLDRCTIDSFVNESGAQFFKQISNSTSISSQPVRVCLCENNEPNCASEGHFELKRGEEFTVEVAALDQVGQIVSATITSTSETISLARSERIGANCSQLKYEVIFPNVSQEYEVTLYADGPCEDKGISKLTFTAYILPCCCAPGLVKENIDTQCRCMCDPSRPFSDYIHNCNSTAQTVTREGKFWIHYINGSQCDSDLRYYLIYRYCPFDYCKPPRESVSINLSLPEGSDEQCTQGRGGLLCGRCSSNYSLSLGSSRCIPCDSHWQENLVVIVLVAFFAGIALVAVVLVLNLTVAIGTLNAIIFYANIINANRRIYFSSFHLTFVQVFVSWLNLDIGIDVCFFKGMDAYAKTWLQLAFPLYIFCLVLLVIWISSCSSRFSNLIGKKNPVATLATLLLLSYAQLLQSIIASISFAVLEYPNNGTTTVRWLPDANLEYRDWRHVILLCVAFLILFLGLLYTILILSWQWLLQCPQRSKFLRWLNNQKLHSFIDTYHTPYTRKHRYWTGLLLLVRIIIYLISALATYRDPGITLLSTIFIMTCLFLYKTILRIKLYKNKLLNAMESFIYFNISAFTIFTSFAFNDSENDQYKGTLQTVIAYLSVGAVMILFLLVVIIHMYRFGSSKLYSYCKNTKLHAKVKTHLSHRLDSGPSDDHDLFDALDNPRQNIQSTFIRPASSDVSYNEQSHEEQQVDAGNGTDEGNRKPRARTYTPKGSATVLIELKHKGETMPKEFSANNLRKPLLDEDSF